MEADHCCWAKQASVRGRGGSFERGRGQSGGLRGAVFGEGGVLEKVFGLALCITLCIGLAADAGSRTRQNDNPYILPC